MVRGMTRKSVEDEYHLRCATRCYASTNPGVVKGSKTSEWFKWGSIPHRMAKQNNIFILFIILIEPTIPNGI